MPIPIDPDDLLWDHFGQYFLCVTCKACGHYGEVTPRDISRRFEGFELKLVSIIPHLGCTQCKARDCRVEKGFEERPRGWVKHPS